MWLLLALSACAGTPSGEPVDGFAGTALYRPKSEPKAAIVLLHGSEGGTAAYTPMLAQRMADEGLLAASFCWFGCDGLPQAVHQVRLERTAEFLEWLEEGPAKGLPVVLYGASRGAEQAVLLASLLGDTKLVDCVAAHASTDTVVAAFDPKTYGPVLAADGYDAAWTWKGAPLYGERALPFGSGPRIEIERFPGPVFLSHGEDDPLWPASRSRSLEKARKDLPTEAHYWAGEGHVLTSSTDVDQFVEELVAFSQRCPAAP